MPRPKKTRRRKKGGSIMRIGYPTFYVDNKSVKTRHETIQQPSITLPSEPRLSTLIMYDPDSSSPSWLHYLVVNIPNGDVSKGEAVAPYTGPAPPSGTHRYIFEHLQQVSPYMPTVDASNRGAFDVINFKNKNNLAMRERQVLRVKAS